jgi:hypothetical protein
MMAEQLCLSTKTVANYVSAVMLKLGAVNREEAAQKIGRRGGQRLEQCRPPAHSTTGTSGNAGPGAIVPSCGP